MAKKYLNITDKQLSIFSFVFFVFMMVFHLTHSSPWGDEWTEFSYSSKGILDGSMYKAIISTFQPPLYNFLMHFWLKLGSSVLWFRLFNVVLGIFIWFALYGTLKILCGETMAAGTLIALGATYQWIFCIQECSEYALMLTFLFLALYLYVRIDESNRFIEEILFILSCVGAMYSQYGAVFVVAPILLFHFFRAGKKNLRKTLAIYIISFLTFAVPLYIFFARIQLQKQAISEHSKIELTSNVFLEFPIVFGKLIEYFLGLQKYNFWGLQKDSESSVIGNILIVFGIIVVILSVIMLTKKDISWLKKSLIGLLLISYTLFYFLVVFHVYAMIHPNQSSGFYSRYAYFFLPIFYVVIPVVLSQGWSWIKKETIEVWARRSCFFFVALSLLIAYPNVLENWHKAYDREFAEIWIENGGFCDTTYLIGIAKPGFEYYAAKSGCKITGSVLNNNIDLENLPDSFWLWRTNWGETWQAAVDKAVKLGYQVLIYKDCGYEGQLAFCKINLEERNFVRQREVYQFNREQETWSTFSGEWFAPENWGRWTGTDFEMSIRLADPVQRDLIISGTAHAFHEPKNVEVTAGGKFVSKLQISPKNERFEFSLPKDFVNNQMLHLNFHVLEEAIAPSEVDKNSKDERKLAIGFVDFCIT